MNEVHGLETLGFPFLCCGTPIAFLLINRLIFLPPGVMMLTVILFTASSYAVDLRGAMERAYPRYSDNKKIALIQIEGELASSGLDIVTTLGSGKAVELVNRGSATGKVKSGLLTLSWMGVAYGMMRMAARLDSLFMDRRAGALPLVSLAQELYKGSPGLGAAQLEFRAPKGAGE